MTDKAKEKIWIQRTKERYPAVWELYCDLIEKEKMSRGELLDYNFKRSLSAMTYAYNHTRFYRELYDAHGVRPEEVRTVEDWDRLPIITKEMVREHAMDMLVPGCDAFRGEATTGGSTGMPLLTAIVRIMFGELTQLQI